MNNEYEERGYVTTQIMDENSATAIWHQLLERVRRGDCNYGMPEHENLREGLENTWNFMNVVPMFFPMSILTPKAEEALGMELVPSYCYARIYMKGSEMVRHVDRDSSVYACTINLNSSHSGWPIYLEDKNGKDTIEFVGKPGEALFYHGCDMFHWRNKFEGDWHAQLMMFWVEKKEENEPFYWDGINEPVDWLNGKDDFVKQVINGEKFIYQSETPIN